MNEQVGRRLKGLDEMPVPRRRSSSTSTRLCAHVGYALCLALAVSITAAHVAMWSSPHAARLFGELVAQCGFLWSTGYSYTAFGYRSLPTHPQ